MAFKGCVALMKYTLIVINLFGILTGLAVLITSITDMMSSDGHHDNTTSLTSSSQLNSLNNSVINGGGDNQDVDPNDQLSDEVIIIFAIITIAVAIIGFFGAYRSSVSLLVTYGFIIFISFFFRIIVLIQSYSINKLDYLVVSFFCAVVELVVTGFSFRLAWEIKFSSRNISLISSSPDQASGGLSKPIVSVVVVETELNEKENFNCKTVPT